MKKRILSLFLIVLVVLGSVSTGLVSAADTIITALSDSPKGTSTDPYIISDYTSFKTYLLINEPYSSKTYFKFTADIAVPSDEELTGNYILGNAEVDGAGHTVSGINLNNAPLYKSVTDSAVRMLNFKDSSAVYSEVSVENCAFFAGEVGKNCFITSCRFDSVDVTVADREKANVATVTVNNSGYITNCVVKAGTLSITADSAVVGTIVAVNNSGGFIVNSIAEPEYDLNEKSEQFTLGGIIGKNAGSMKYCYAIAYPYDNSRNDIYPAGVSTGTLEYNLFRGERGVEFDNGTVEKTDYMGYSTTLSVLMTELVISGYNSKLSSRFNKADFACPWTVRNHETDLSFDGKEAYVTISVKPELSSAKISFSTDDVSYDSDYNEYVVKVGSYSSDGAYTRNNINIEYVCNTPATMVKNFVMSAKYNCVYKLDDVMTGSGTYSVQYEPAKQTGEVNTATIGLNPYPAVLSLTSVNESDELVPYHFEGSGTKDAPFLISNEYELVALSKHVSNGETYGEDKKPYNKAHYLLTSDITLTQEFNPIGVKSTGEGTAFSGVFDGGRHTIKGLKISEGLSQSGLFGVVKGEQKGLYQSYAEIKDLIIEGASIEGIAGTENAIKGILVGQAEYAIISGCFTTGDVSGDTQIAGVIGYAYECKVSNCGSYANVNTYSSTAWAGGVVGHAQHSDVRNCYYAGDLVANSIVEENYLNIGGVAGYITNSTFGDCYHTPDKNINWATDVKGITQVSEDEAKGGALLENLISYNEENGITVYWMSGDKSYPVITTPDKVSHNVYLVSNRDGSCTMVGLTNPVAPGTRVTIRTTGYRVEVTDLNNNENVASVTKGNGEFYFTMPSQSVKVHPVYNVRFLEGKGTKEEPYLIYNLRELKQAIEISNSYSFYESAYFKLCADIDCGGESLDSMYSKYTFKGVFDGDGHAISNAKLSGSFIENMSGELKNLTLENVSSQGESFLLGNVNGDSVLCNITVKNCNVQSAVIARDVNAKLSVYNSVIDSVNTTADTLSVYYKTCSGSMTVNNLVILDTDAKEVMFAPVSHSGNVTASNVYYGSNQTFIAGNFSCMAVTPSEYKSVDFILGLSSTAKNSLSSQGAYMWGAESLSGNPELATDDTVTTPYKITYSSVIDTSSMLDVDKIPSAAFANNIVEIYYNPAYSISGIIIEANGRRLNYITSDSDNEDRNVLRFIMPEGDVQISYDGETPSIYHLLGHGTESDPYRISHKDELLHFSDVVNQVVTVEHPSDGTKYVDYHEAYVVLAKDMDFGETDWKPIGNSDSSFYGVFDGRGFSIYGDLFVKAEKYEKVGLFGDLSGTVCNLNLAIDYHITNSSSKHIFFGALAGRMRSGRIENVYSECTVNADCGLYACGGLVGEVYSYYTNGKKAYISKCISNNEYQAAEINYFGGVVGYGVFDEYCSINNCANLSDVTITSAWYAAGIIPYVNDAKYVSVTNCYNSGVITAEARVGGIISYYDDYAGGFKAFSNNYFLTSSIKNVDYKSTSAPESDFLRGRIAYLLNSGVTDGTQVWYQNIDNGLPKDESPLLVNNGNNTVYKVDRENKEYSNIPFDKDYIYEISNPQELMAFSALVNSGEHSLNAIVVADIDMSGYEYTPIGQTGLYYKADPAEGESKGYAGKFDGQGHIISNLTVKGSASADLSYGLFGTVSGEVHNIGLESFTYTGAGRDSRVGAVAGQLICGGKIYECYLHTGNINTQVNTSDGVAGGIAGANYTGEVKSCYTKDVTIKAGRLGGIVGDNYGDANNSDGTDRPGTITGCYTDYSVLCARGNSSDSFVNVSDRRFESGEITYMLNEQSPTREWLQSKKGAPSFQGDKVYQNYCEGDVFYSTTQGDFEFHEIDVVRCVNCHNFDSATLVDENNFESLGLTKDYIGMYAVENASNMYWFSEKDALYDLKGGIVLMNDIIIDSVVEPWIPIAVDGNFTFDGRGHTLTLMLDFGEKVSSDYQGLFSNFNYGVIKDLYLAGDVRGCTTSYVGGLSASMYRTTVTKVISYANVTNACTTGGCAGGIAGYFGGKHANGLYSKITNCAVYADVTGYIAGGFIGEGWNGTQYYDISNCAYMGNVTGINAAGAIIGYQATDSNTSRFTDVYWCEADSLPFYGKRDTSNQVYTRTVAKTAEQFARGEVTYLLNNGITNGTQVWCQNIDNDLGVDKYPLFAGGTVYERLDKSYSNYLFIPAVYNSTTGYYEVENESQLYWISSVVNGDHTYAKFSKTPVSMKVKLLSDLDLSVMNMPFTPIGNTENKCFNGTFDGNGYTISGITLYAGEYTGLFGVNSGIIRNLRLTGMISLVADSPVEVNCFGAVTGKAKGGQIMDVYSNLTYDLSNVKSIKYMGSLAGCTGSSAVDFFRCIAHNTYSSTEVSTDYFGGIVGYVEKSCRVQHCGNVSAFDVPVNVAAGGLVGGTQCDNMIIVDSYTCGETKGATGAIIGICNMGDIIAYNNYYPDVYATGSEFDKAGKAMEPYDFISGKVAYLMNYGATDGTQAWYQTILTDYVPVPDSTHKTVYKTGEDAYSNDPEGGGMISGGNPMVPTDPESETGKEETNKDTVNTGSVNSTLLAVSFVVLWLSFALILVLQKRKAK